MKYSWALILSFFTLTTKTRKFERLYHTVNLFLKIRTVWV